jgi:transcriptional regulator with XRE-family HTH domain
VSLEINHRIFDLRKEVGLNQFEFGKRIGVTRSAICNYENGSRSVGEQVILAICREFNISEEWLRTGVGEMFVQQSRTDELSSFVNILLQSEPSDIRHRFVMAISRLSTRELEVLEKTAIHLADELNMTGQGRTRDEKPIAEWTDADIDADVAEYRRHLLDEKEQAVRSSVLQSSNDDSEIKLA